MASNTGLTKTHNFYAEDKNVFKRWYIDLPKYLELGGEKADLEMIMGADFLLDILSNGEDVVTIKFSTEVFDDSEVLSSCGNELRIEGELVTIDDGKFYQIHTLNNKWYHQMIWLCDVVKFIFEDTFPKKIYFKVINQI